MLIVVVILLIALLVLANYKEGFRVFAWNNQTVDDSNELSVTKTETSEIIANFQGVYDTAFSTFDTSVYTKVPFFNTQNVFFINSLSSFIETDMNNRLAGIISARRSANAKRTTSAGTTTGSTDAPDKYIVTEITDIYTYKENDILNIICNTTVINRKVFTARRLQYKLKLSRMSRYSNVDILNTTVSHNDLIIIAVRLNDTFNIESKVTPLNKTNNLFYIKNNLYLMSPFFTSDRDISTGLVTVQKDILEKDRVKDFESGLAQMKCFNRTTGEVQQLSGCLEAGHVIDRVPQGDSDCVYYQANKNYPNTFGGLELDPKSDLNRCVQPYPLETVGYRYSTFGEPLCHNCKSDTNGKIGKGFCCEDQKNKNKYPNLLSPDYVFPGDTSVRELYKTLLEGKGMSV